MKRICVFCGSNLGILPQYRQAASQLAQSLARRRIGIVYGGASVGLMGVLADTMLNAGGEIIGVIPRMLVQSELAHHKLTALHEVDSMHQRKALMAELSDGFVAMPGGFGTLEEFTEVISWKLLGIHQKPCALLNVNGYFDGLLRFLDFAVSQRFIKPAQRASILVADEPEPLLKLIEKKFTAGNGRWLERRQQT